LQLVLVVSLVEVKLKVMNKSYDYSLKGLYWLFKHFLSLGLRLNLLIAIDIVTILIIVDQ
jgi:hypothetical protein